MKKHEPEVQTVLTQKAGFLDKLPETCFGTLPGGSPEYDELIILKRGEMGYWPTEGYSTNELFPTFGDVADLLNNQRGVTKAQRAAMEAGSMFGFHVPGADPDMYGEDGRLK